MSYKTRVAFTVEETVDGRPFLIMEFQDDIPGLPADPPFFDLREGATMEEAELVAEFLNARIASYRPLPMIPKDV